MILQQSSSFMTNHWDSPSMSALSHPLLVTVMLLCSLYACMLQVHKFDFTLSSLDLDTKLPHFRKWFVRSVSFFTLSLLLSLVKH